MNDLFLGQKILVFKPFFVAASLKILYIHIVLQSKRQCILFYLNIEK